MRNEDLLRAAEQYGTPLYVYDLDEAAARARALKEALGGAAELLYAVKANPNKELLRHALSWADGLDISSGGELRIARDSGWDPARMSLAGPGKSLSELDLAVSSGCGSISVESLDDLERILEAGRRAAKAPRLSLRVNPLELNGPFALKMGGKPTQFGVDEEDAPAALSAIAAAAREGRAEYAGIHIYAGTQCLDAAALIENVKNSLRIAAELEKASGFKAQTINLGGGFGLAYYEGQEELDLAAAGAGIAAALMAFKAERPYTGFALELGRYLVGPAGWYLTRVLAVKRSRGKTYAIVDGGMHQHLSASGNLGQTIKRNYRMKNLSNEGGASAATELAGCLCTPIDLLGFGAPLPQARVGDLISLENSGAYGYTASPLFFLGHDAPREAAFEGGAARIVREALSPAELS
jgi:diaminopimelate decarboxylase